MVSNARIHTKILSDSHQKDVFLQKNRRSIKFPKFREILQHFRERPLETHGNSVILGRSVGGRML